MKKLFSIDERLKKSVQLGLPFLARVLREHRLHPVNKDIPLNFNPIAGVVKGSPEALQGNFSLDKDGSVSVLVK